MKVLQISHKPPIPAIDGGCIAINNTSKALIDELGSIKILTLSTYKHPFDINFYDKEYQKKTSIESSYIDTRIKISDAIINLLKNNSYNISRFYSTEFKKLIIKTLKSNTYDIVVLESLFTCGYIKTIKDYSTSKIILRSHNIEHKIWDKISNESLNPIKKIYFKILSNQLKNYELEILKKIDGVACISDNYKNEFERLDLNLKIETIPFGINIKNYRFKDKIRDDQKLKFFHIGAMDWLPNSEAAKWLINEIWPRIHKKIPNAELHLAGKNMPDWVNSSLKLNIYNHKEVKDSLKFITQHDIMLVPLLSGSGIRVKIVEGMALGKAIISTSLAAEGIDYEKDVNLMIANSVEEFCNNAEKIYYGNLSRKKIGLNARKLVEKNHNQNKISKKLVSFLESVL
jgi:glycosyltransferase involved in cell wall biosynthesis